MRGRRGWPFPRCSPVWTATTREICRRWFGITGEDRVRPPAMVERADSSLTSRGVISREGDFKCGCSRKLIRDMVRTSLAELPSGRKVSRQRDHSKIALTRFGLHPRPDSQINTVAFSGNHCRSRFRLFDGESHLRFTHEVQPI
jgi:hypothetical protein